MNVKNPKLLKRIGGFPGLFILQPVITSSGFIPVDQSRGIFGDPEILNGLVEEFKREIDFSKIDAVAGIDLAGVSLATAISLSVNKPLVIVREKPKREGRPAVIGATDFIKNGTRILLVDDLIAHGKSKLDRIEQLESLGCQVTDLAVWEDIPMKRAEIKDELRILLRDKGINIHALFTFQELVELGNKYQHYSTDLLDILNHFTEGWLFDDDSYGYLTKLVKVYKDTGTPIPVYVQEYLSLKKVAYE